MVVPGLSDVYDTISGILGEASITGQKLDTIDRIIALAAAVLPLIPAKVINLGKNAIE